MKALIHMLTRGSGEDDDGPPTTRKAPNPKTMAKRCREKLTPVIKPTASR